MLKKTITLSWYSITQLTHAETCPTISDLDSNIFKRWQIFNANSGEPLNPRDLNDFKANIGKASFAMAEWMPDAPEGPAHCYYANNIKFYLEGIYKMTAEPDLRFGNWHKGSLDIMQCHVSPRDCRFG